MFEDQHRFQEQYRRDNDKLHAREDLLVGIKARAEKESAKRAAAAAARRTVLRYGAMAAAFVLVLGGAFGIGRFVGMNGAVSGSVNEAVPMAASAETASEPSAAAGARVIGAPLAPASEEQTDGAPRIDTAVDSYEALYELIAGNLGTSDRVMAGGGLLMGAPVAEEAAEEEAAPEAAPEPSANKVSASLAEAPAMEAGVDGDYSETNVQVAGVDEADIVKTDGKHIYYIADGTLVIAEAAGKDTKILSETALLSEEENDTYFNHAMEMYLLENRLIVLQRGAAMLWQGRDNRWEDITCMMLYDISEPANPKLIEEIGQTGSYVSSRMTDGRIYLVTQQYLGRPVEAVPLSYVPAVWMREGAQPIAAEKIYIPDRDTTHAYTVIGSFDAKAPREDRSLTAILGHTGEIYCNLDHLLLAQDVSEYVQGQVEPNADYDGQNVAINRHESRTRLMLYELGKKPQLLASGEVRGRLLNQFSMDEYQGVFRIVTTVNDWREIIFTDGLDRYEWEDETYNCLYTLNAELKPMGALEKLAENEWVESVRFDGDIAYFVTFRQTDPLFTVDLSDPANPKVLSELKIPGFSEYLHGFGAGRLLGVGYDADPETGWRQGVKLTMFDTANKADVRELQTKLLSADSTPVGSNHKAILVDVSRGLIAFPADESYYVFTYTEEEGFVQKGKLETGRWGTDLRGVRIGEELYICTDTGITVISLGDYSITAHIAYTKKNA